MKRKHYLYKLVNCKMGWKANNITVMGTNINKNTFTNNMINWYSNIINVRFLWYNKQLGVKWSTVRLWQIKMIGGTCMYSKWL